MKTSRIIPLTIIIAAIITNSAKADNEKYKKLPEDTIEIQFGDKSKIIIQVENKKDLEAIQRYDINSMIKDIELPEEEDLENEEAIIYEDTSGTRYLNEEPKPKKNDEFSELEKEFENMHSKDRENGHTSENKRVHHGPGNEFIKLFYFGMNNYIESGDFPDADNAQYTVRPWGSWFVAIAPTWQTHIFGPLAIDHGFGISWYNFKFQEDNTLLYKGDDQIIFDQWEPQLYPIKSKLTVMYLEAHVVPMLDFGYRRKVKTHDDGRVKKTITYRTEGLRIGAGIYAGYRINSYTKFIYKDDGDRNKVRERGNYYLNNLKYGVRVQFGLEDVDFFFNYDLNKLFSENRGPELNAFSFGLSF